MWLFSSKKQQGVLVLITIDNLRCSSCALHIDMTLESIAGVYKAETDYGKSISRVWYDDTKVSAEQLLKAIANLSYIAKLVV